MSEYLKQALIALVGLISNERFVGFSGALIGAAVGSILAFGYNQRQERLARLRTLRGEIEKVCWKLARFRRMEITSDEWGRHETECRTRLVELSERIVSTREDFPPYRNKEFEGASEEYDKAREVMAQNATGFQGRHSYALWWALRDPLNKLRDATKHSFTAGVKWNCYGRWKRNKPTILNGNSMGRE